MKIMSIEDFCDSNASLQFVNALRQTWYGKTRFSCLGHPKKQDILVFLSGCSMRIHTKNGKEIKIQENGIYYAPCGSEYVLEVSRKAGAYTIGVNFNLVDEQGEPFVFSEDVMSFRASSTIAKMFEKLVQNGSLSRLHSRALLETVIAEIGRESSVPTVPASISKSVAYMHAHFTESLTVAQLAAISCISEVYFRRIFKQTFHESPAAYIIRLRLRRAAEYLEYADVSVREVAELVGYGSASYFANEFKERYGMTPLLYRRAKTDD